MRHLIILACAGLMLAACTQPYTRPILDENGAVPGPFSGIDSLLSSDLPGRVLWVHGMCPHHPDWAQDRAQMVLSELGAGAALDQPINYDPAHPNPPGTDERAYTIDRTFTVPGKGKIEVDFSMWSNLVDPYIANIQKPDGMHTDPLKGKLTRASLNATLEDVVMDQCLVDAVVYSGPNGAPIKQALRGHVCKALGGTGGETGPCEIPENQAAPKVAFVSESIGSKFLFDAIRGLWSDANAAGAQPRHRSELSRRLARVAMVYMAANQIPILDQATQPAHPDPAAPSDSVRGLTSLLRENRQAFRAEAVREPLLVVAFQDPNDMLSYRLLPGIQGPADMRFINVTVSNDWSYLGWAERPDTAHCGYRENKSVSRFIIHGYAGGTPDDPGSTEADSACLSG